MPAAQRAPRHQLSTEPLVRKLAEKLPDMRVLAYDGCASGPADAPTTISFRSSAALAQVARAPRGLGLARAWVNGQIDVQGDWYSLIRHEHELQDPRLIFAALSAILRIAPTLRLKDLRATGPTAIEFRQRHPGTHTIDQDKKEADFHYGLSPEFYRYLLGPTLTYSGAIFASGTDTLDEAQDNKHRLIAGKLQLDDTSVVLDVGCGWGSFITYAVRHHGCHAIGVTAAQSQYARLQHLLASEACPAIKAIYGDYREKLPIKGVTAAASIGMYEHVGAQNSIPFFSLIRACLQPGFLYLNQAIIMRENGPRRFRRNSFVERYIFPNGQLLPLSRQLRDLQSADFQVISVHRYGDSYALTIRQWLKNLEANWEACARLEGEQRVRAWYIYLMGSMARFERRDIDLVQVTARAR